jgi:hypothetical protein
VAPNYTVSGSIYQNFVKGGTNTLGGINGVFAPNASMYRNIIIGFIVNTAFHWSSNCPNGVFYNNTIYNAHYGFLIDSGSTATIENNIMSTMTSRGIALGAGSSVTEDYNLSFKDGRGNYGVVPGLHDIHADPRFISATPATAGDVRLQSDSPAIGSGMPVPFPYRWALDPAGTTFPFPVVDESTLSSAWTIGAFAFRP